MDSNERESLVQGPPVRDMGVSREYSDLDIDTNANTRRHESMFIGLRMPRRPHRPGKSRSKRHADRSEIMSTNTTASLTPSEQIQQLLGDHDEDHKSHDVFCQMDVLFKIGPELQWRESARWVKYEEDVEEGGERWSKPHVASLSLHSLFELRSTLLTGAVILDMDIHHISQLSDLLVEHLVNAKLLEEHLKDPLRTVLLAPHAHQHQKRRRSVMPGEEMPRGLSFRRLSKLATISDFQKATKGKDDASSTPRLSMKGNPNSVPNMDHLHLNGGLTESPSSSKLNQQFMRKIPDGAEAANIMVGEVEGLKYQVSAFIRLSDARYIGDLTEVPIPTRFVYIILGPPETMGKLTEIARSISTIMVDEVFREVAFKARNRQDILSGIDEFLDQVTVLPPGEWDPKIRIEPPDSVPSQAGRKVAKMPSVKKTEEHHEEEEESHCDPTLQRTGRLFGGLIADIKRKLPWYGSDFKDCLHIQCVASIIFLYLATLTPNVTFGGLLGIATDQYMGTMECILTASIVGVLFALFAGQPLNILGSTGPMLVLEMILYHFCHDNHMDFLPFRCWIGIWTAVILLLIVAFDLSALVRYITRFTEESFACLIAIIFIYEAFKKQIGILDKAPINPDPGQFLDYDCWCAPENITNSTMNYTFSSPLIIGNMTFDYPLPIGDMAYRLFDFNSTTNTTLNETIWAGLTKKDCTDLYNGTLIGSGCDTPVYVSDVFFLSVLLFIGTFTVATGLVTFKTSGYFPTFVRQTVSDFAVLIAIILMVGIDALIGIDTPKLQVPEKFEPSRPGRGWIVNPVSGTNPWWTILAAIIPALLATILIFMDQQITAVIVNRKENKLKKGNGYHLDMLVVAICIVICSFLGLPWYVAATVSAIAHIMSLRKESECTAPGERPIFLGVREQRVTALMVGLLSGLSVLMTSILRIIPMAVLYGVFLYMGVAALKGMQFIDRILLIFMPAKYQPDTAYLRHVPIKRVHLFTIIQVICLAVLWVVKQIKSVSIIFPIMVLGTCFVRKGMDFFFERHELKWLDDIMPEAKKRETEDAGKGDHDEEESLLGEEMEKLMEMKMQHQMASEKFGRHTIDTDRVNISEEVHKTGIWLQVRRDSVPIIENGTNNLPRSGKRKKDKNEKNSGGDSNKKPGFYVGDEEETDQILEMPEEGEERENKV